MEYFKLSQQSNILNKVELFLSPKAPNKIKIPFDKAEANQLKDIASIYMKSDEKTTFPDLFDTPSLIVSDRLKELLEIYDNDIIFKCAVFTNPKTKEQKVYWLTLIDAIDCLSDKSEFDKAGSLKTPVMDKNKVKDSKIFRIKNTREHFIYVNLDVAESILRRYFVGINLEKVLSQ